MAVRQSVAEIAHEGTKIILPLGMDYHSAIRTLQKRQQYDEETMEITEVIDAFPLDAAYALQRAINEQFGWSEAQWIPGGWFMPDQPPELRPVQIGVDESVLVPWGRFTLPGIKGHIQTGYTRKNNLIVFELTAEVLRKHEEAIRQLAGRTRVIVRESSIYRGKAIKIRFTDDNGKPNEMPDPKFLDVSQAFPDRLVFSNRVFDDIATNLYTPIVRYGELRAIQSHFKRGVLLAGEFGTGKTELAFTAGHLATQNRITFLYCEDVTEFGQAIQFIQSYAPGIVFCEDIDRVSKDGERNDALNKVLNIMDGIEAKGTEVMSVLTTNQLDIIHQAMIRPGRIDSVIEVQRPDADAVRRLVRLYAQDKLDEEEDLSEIGAILHNQLPAVIEEVVKRSKLAALRRSEPGHAVRLTGAALAESAQQMARQLELLDRRPTPKPSDLELAGHVIGRQIADGLGLVAQFVTPGERQTLERAAALPSGNAHSH